MISRVTLRRFKRYSDETFELPDYLVLAGPNNAGKTTLLQAIAAWGLTLDKWRQNYDVQKHGKAYTRVPVGRRDFLTIPIRAYDLLWNERDYKGAVEIEVRGKAGWTITMMLEGDTSEQIFVRPSPNSTPDAVKNLPINITLATPVTGLGIDEPRYTWPKISEVLGRAAPGEVFRNLLVEAHQSGSWSALTRDVEELFGYEIVPPDPRGAHILAEYRERPGGPLYDVASAGSGFQQVVMLLALLYGRPSAVLLIDEPDAHLHVILQDTIYGRLRRVAAAQRSQLIVATHSEVIINSVEPKEICVVIGKPRLLSTEVERDTLAESLGILTNNEILQAKIAPGILYTEDYTDLLLLRAWAKTLEHPILEYLTVKLLWRPIVAESRSREAGVHARDHYAAIKLVQENIPALELVDGDAHSGIRSTPITGSGFQRIRWRRYEIESYLIHPASLERFVRHQVGPGSAQPHVAALHEHLQKTYPPDVLAAPLGNHTYLNNTKARTELIPPALEAAGVIGLPHTRYCEIAALMLRQEIHPEVREKLDAMQKAFGL